MNAFDQPRLLELPQCTLRYFDERSGRAVLFVQGIWTSQQLWLGVVRKIGGGARCLRVEWPLGGHNEPVPPAVDLSPFAVAKLVLDFIAALDLEDVTLIGNDTGGAVCLLAVTMFDHSAWHRLSGLVLTDSDSYENFLRKHSCRSSGLRSTCHRSLAWSSDGSPGRQQRRHL